MKIQQLAVFLQNKPGHLGGYAKRLPDNDINIMNTVTCRPQQLYPALIVKRKISSQNVRRLVNLVQLREVCAVRLKTTGGIYRIVEI